MSSSDDEIDFLDRSIHPESPSPFMQNSSLFQSTTTTTNANSTSQANSSSKILRYFSDATQDKVDVFVDEYPSMENLPEFTKFIDDSENPEVGEQIYLRIAQSIINRWDQKTTMKCKRSLIEIVHNLYDAFVEQSVIDESEFVERLLNLLAPLMRDSMGKLDGAAIHHRNICLMLNVAMARYQNCFGDVNRERTLSYLVRIVEECTTMETVLFACFAVESLTWRQQISKDLAGRLRKGLQKYSDNLNQCPLSILSSTSFDRTRFQVGQCARWLIESVLVDRKLGLQHDELSVPVKLSPDRLSARCDQFGEFPTVCSVFPVNSGTFYYEATLLTSGPMTIGWATRETDFNKGIGFDQFSIGINGFQRVVYHGGNKGQVDKAWKEGDILGCLIDVGRKKFAFYLNGKKMDFKLSAEPNFSSQSYYAMARLYPHQQCYFNFGQAPFRYPPTRGVQYSDFHSEAEENAERYHLQVPSLTEHGSYWFRMENPDNRVGMPFFRDEKQNQFDRLIIKLICKITDLNQEESFNNALEDEFKDLMMNGDANASQMGLLRLFQSIVEELGSTVKEDKIDIVVGLIEHYLALIEHDQKAPNLAKLLELIYPYMQLKSKCLCDKNTLKHRNLCLVLSLLRKCDEETQSFLQNKEVLSFLGRILTDSELEPSQLFAVICLDVVNPELIRFTSKLEELSRFLNKCSYECLYTPTFDYYRYQIAFCARWHLDRLNPEPTQRSAKSNAGEAKAKLDILDKTPGIKISSDRMGVRSDSEWQSISSVFPVTSGIYFYEVILLTSGSMRIGWATKECEFEEGKSVGNDEYSIGYDGYQKKICHIYGDYTLLKKNVRQWKAGDVVGCLIDVAEKRFAFYLNGNPIEYQADVFFSNKPYFAAVSLSAHQQCYFNFGQAPFKFAPTDIPDMRDFHNAFNQNLCPFCSKNDAIARFANCDHWSVCLDCMGRLKKCPTCNPNQ